MSEVWSNQTEAEEGYPKLARFTLAGPLGPFIMGYNVLHELTVIFDLDTLSDEYQDNRQRTDSEQIEQRP